MTDPLTEARAVLEKHGKDGRTSPINAIRALDAALRILIEHAETLEAERDAAQAVIAQALDAAGHGQPTIYRVARILQSVPLDALQAERARAWTEGLDAVEFEDPPRNPYITHTEGDEK